MGSRNLPLKIVSYTLKNIKKLMSEGAVMNTQENQAVLLEEEVSKSNCEDVNQSAKYIHNITFPSALVDKKFGEKLKEAVKSGEVVIVNLDWREVVPHPYDLVKYGLWTNSNDKCGPKCDMLMDFVKDFNGAVQILEKGGYSQFTPHYITWFCPYAFIFSKQCKSQCINQGRYFAPDPEKDFSTGYEGKGAMEESSFISYRSHGSSVSELGIKRLAWYQKVSSNSKFEAVFTIIMTTSLPDSAKQMTQIQLS